MDNPTAKLGFTMGSWNGPLYKLLELVEERKLSISEVSLAQVTNDFLNYVRSLKEVSPAVLADFIAVASQLLLIKSKFLLPGLSLTEEEKGQIHHLEQRLAFLAKLKPVLKKIAALWNSNYYAISRPYLLLSKSKESSVFYPGDSLNAAALRDTLGGIIELCRKLELENKTLEKKIVSIEEKVEEIINRLREAGGANFRSMAEHKSRSEVIAIFLALLYLAREQVIRLEQHNYFSDIVIIKT